MRPLSSSPTILERYFDSNFQDQFNPFITPESRPLSKNLKFRTYLFAAFLYLLALILKSSPQTLPLAHICIAFVYFITGVPSLIRTINLLTKFKISISALMTLSAFLSFLIGSLYEGALLLLLFALSGAMEEQVLVKAKSALYQLNSLNPTKARVLNNKGIPFEKSVKDITSGSHILVQAGEIIPLDGEVIEGSSSISMAQITGESLPLKVKIGDEVISGSKNYEGALVIKTTKAYSSSTLCKLIHLITQAQERKPKLQKTFNKYVQTYAQSIIALCLAFALCLPFFLNIPYLGPEGSFYRAIAFLIGASPCALILALPISSLTAISHLSKKGILIKGSSSLERLSQCNYFVFDKTGTLTKGDLSIQETQILQGQLSEKQLLAYAASLEVGSTHPIAKAFIQEAEKQQLQLCSVTEFKNLAGTGVEGKIIVEGKEETFFLGKTEEIENKLDDQQISLLKKQQTLAQEKGNSLVALYSRQCLALIALQDTLRPYAEELIQKLQKDFHIPSTMLTGDYLQAAQRLKLPFKHIYAQLRPEEKLEKIQELLKDYKVAMIGDGLNDAPSLSIAHCGISMGKIGSQSSLQASHIILMQEDLSHIPYVYAFARKTQAIIQQNLILALSAITITSISSLFGLIPLWLAVICHEGSTLLVGLNGLRLLKKIP